VDHTLETSRFRRIGIWLGKWFVILVAVGLLGRGVFFWAPMPTALTAASLKKPLSLRIVDRNGKLLREVQSGRLGVAHWKRLDQISKFLISATLLSEDRRFYSHFGIDPTAVVRAIKSNMDAGGIRQGGSTITQQLVRNLLSPSIDGADRDLSRGWKKKLLESYWAVRLECSTSKDEILESYLNRIYYGNQCYGIEAAARFYFSRGADQLSLAQSTFLAVLPRAPESFLPFQRPEEIEKYQFQLLERLRKTGAISEQEFVIAIGEKIEFKPTFGSFRAGHFCDYVLAQNAESLALAGVVKTTLDIELQEDFEKILRTQVDRLGDKNVHNGALVALDLNTGEILAMVGSTSYEKSQFNAALAGRQPGSSLKPFTYGIAMEIDKTPASLLPDLNLYPNQVKNGYIPHNYDEKFHGPVRLRTALACSYNVPVVRVLEEIGTESLLLRLRQLGFNRLTKNANHYGLGLTLGDGEVTLLQLCNAYRCLGRQGLFQESKWEFGDAQAPETRVFNRGVCFLLGDILQDAQERAPAFGPRSVLEMPFWCPVKTGTSKGYRDNWTLGFSRNYVVGVWVGNLDGGVMRKVSGVTGAAPVFREVMSVLEKRSRGFSNSVAPHVPSGIERATICPQSGMLASAICPNSIQDYFLAHRKPTKPCLFHRLKLANGQLLSVESPGVDLARLRHLPGNQVVITYPPLYRGWMRQNHMADYPWGVSESRNQDARPVQITFPDGESYFRCDPQASRQTQKIHFKAKLPAATTRVAWLVDQRPIPSESDFSAWWQLVPGRHDLTVQAFSNNASLGQSESIHFTVR
jgi:penicillin-binding protein 1C